MNQDILTSSPQPRIQSTAADVPVRCPTELLELHLRLGPL